MIDKELFQIKGDHWGVTIQCNIGSCTAHGLALFSIKDSIGIIGKMWIIRSMVYNMVSILISWFWSLYCGYIRDFVLGKYLGINI